MREDFLKRTIRLDPNLPEVCRFGLATHGHGKLRSMDVETAITNGMNFLYWRGEPDYMSDSIAGFGKERHNFVIAVRFKARTAKQVAREFASALTELRTDYLDIAILYYVQTHKEWERIIGFDGAWSYLAEQKRLGLLKMIGLSSHCRPLAAQWSKSGRLDLLMARYNAAHRGAEVDLFPITGPAKLSVISFTALRWGDLLLPTPDDPPGCKPPSAASCYRFCLEHQAVSVVLTGPALRSELDQALTVLADWRSLDQNEREALCQHGFRVKKHAEKFW
jgi:predicted aldo/keto reductase-like oxidoreductase